jgi:hypothetical protein
MSNTNTPNAPAPDNANNIFKNLKNIENTYKNLTYFDQYGSSIVLFILISVVLFILCCYCFVMINAQPIKDDWINQRCKPSVIPFAGLINAPDGTSAGDFTKQNFDYCTQNIVKSVTGGATQPLTFITNMLNSLFDSIKHAINGIRDVINKIRLQIAAVVKEIMGRILNMMIPLQQIIIGLKDMLGKIQGALTASLFTLLGAYYTLKSLMGAIAQLIVTILIGLAAMVAVLWIVPFTWGAAAVNTAMFLAISVPMALILTFMIKVLKVQSNLKIPTIKCFDKNTALKMNNGNTKIISEIKVGDILINNNEVTGIIKVATEGSIMFYLNGIIVSDSHIINYKDKWISVSKHPESKKIVNYDEPFLYCLNTSSKVIIINNYCFTDWDEIYDNNINKYKTFLNIKFYNSNYVFNTSDIHKYFDGGFNRETLIKLQNGINKKIIDINIGDILENGENVYGLVEINGNNMNEQFTYYLGKNTTIYGGGNLYFSDGTNILTTFDLDKLNKQTKNINDNLLYHLLTDTKTYNINKIKIYDYNASVDLFLNKIF